MTTTITTQETVSAEPTQTNSILERPGTHYTYLGEDTAGGHHHLEEDTNTVYVTDTLYDQYLPDNAAIYWFRVRGTLEHVQPLGERSVREWTAHVEDVRGWTTPPLLIDGSITKALFDGGRHR